MIPVLTVLALRMELLSLERDETLKSRYDANSTVIRQNVETS